HDIGYLSVHAPDIGQVEATAPGRVPPRKQKVRHPFALASITLCDVDEACQGISPFLLKHRVCAFPSMLLEAIHASLDFRANRGR
ncbi:hypothetical protein LLE87_30955, partial [Paenibacillus polymyxa]|nr:hypothetical protein [Paenibacillus polymyxa]